MKKNRKLKKILPFLLSIVMASQVGCSSIEVGDIEDVSISKDADDIDDNLEDVGIEEEKVIEEIYSDHYTEFLSSYEVYFNDRYFLSDEEINSIYKKLDSVVECSFSGNDTVDTLYNKIKDNSSRYINEHLEYSSCFGDDLVNLEQEVIFKDIFYSVVSKHFNIYPENRKDDMCRMQTLKIVYDDNEEDKSMLGLYDEQENIIFLYRMNIEQHALDLLREKGINIDKEPFVYENFMKKCLKDIFSHEFDHLVQGICNCNVKLNGEAILSYDQNVDGDYYVSLLSESSAESYSIYSNDEYCYDANSNIIPINSEDYNYDYERKVEGLFLFMSLFKEGVTIRDYYSAIGSNDINNLLDFFELSPTEFFRLLYIIDGINFRNGLYEEYEREFGSIETGGDFLKFEACIGSGYKAEIFRIVLGRMIIYTKNNPDFSVEENLFLFDFIKNKIFYDSKNYDRNGNEVKDDKFINDVVELEETYIDFLANHYMEGSNENISYIRGMEVEQKGLFTVLYDVIMDRDVSNYSSDNLEFVEGLLDRFSLLEPICYSVGKNGNTFGYEYYIKGQEINETHSLRKVRN